MPLDLTKPVQTRDGRKVRILCTDADRSYPVVGLITGHFVEDGIGAWRDDGRNQFGRECDLVNVPEPERTLFVNLYPYPDGNGDYIGSWGRSKSQADGLASPTRIACVPLTYRPGQGLD